MVEAAGVEAVQSNPQLLPLAEEEIDHAGKIADLRPFDKSLTSRLSEREIPRIHSLSETV